MNARELYLRAISSTSLTIDPDRRTQADTIIAAGMCAPQTSQRDLALRVWRLRASSEMQGARQLADDLAPMVMRMSVAGVGKFSRPTVSRIKAAHIAMETLKWWCMQTCPACHGRGHPVILNTPKLDTTRDCHHCEGTGIRPMHRYVKNHALAQKLVDKLNSLAAAVFSDMARKLADDMSGFDPPANG